MPDTSKDTDLSQDIKNVADAPTNVAAWGAVLVGLGVFIENGAGGSWSSWITGALPIALSGLTAILAAVRTKKK